ncbi:MAG: tetratricopeptide repeat protein [Rhizomicrobium sp.]
MTDKAPGPTFRRAVPPDMPAHLAQIEAQRAVLARARAGSSEAALIDAAGSLGFSLFIAGQEAEAAPLLEEALALSRKTGDVRTEIDGLLGLGTAVQYLGAWARSVALFREGLRLCDASGFREQENFLLHHLGRCYVEMGRIAEAKAAFEQALALRKAIGAQRFIDATQAALDDIAAL